MVYKANIPNIIIMYPYRYNNIVVVCPILLQYSTITLHFT